MDTSLWLNGLHCLNKGYFTLLYFILSLYQPAFLQSELQVYLKWKLQPFSSFGLLFPGKHRLRVAACQSSGQVHTASGNGRLCFLILNILSWIKDF